MTRPIRIQRKLNDNEQKMGNDIVDLSNHIMQLSRGISLNVFYKAIVTVTVETARITETEEQAEAHLLHALKLIHEGPG